MTNECPTIAMRKLSCFRHVNSGEKISGFSVTILSTGSGTSASGCGKSNLIGVTKFLNGVGTINGTIFGGGGMNGETGRESSSSISWTTVTCDAGIEMMVGPAEEEPACEDEDWLADVLVDVAKVVDAAE